MTKNFITQEFFSPTIYKRWGEKSIWFIDPKIPKLAQFYKDYFSGYFGENISVVINNWAWSGKRRYSGFDEGTCRGENSLSQHRFGRAFDALFYKKKELIDPDEIRRIILEDQITFMLAGLTTLENGVSAPTWVHSDVRTTGLSNILIV